MFRLPIIAFAFAVVIPANAQQLTNGVTIDQLSMSLDGRYTTAVMRLNNTFYYDVEALVRCDFWMGETPVGYGLDRAARITANQSSIARVGVEGIADNVNCFMVSVDVFDG